MDLKQSRVSTDDNYKKFKPDDDQLIKRDIGEDIDELMVNT